ncbi:MAG TPA: alpha/beta hydrolase [Thermotogota bacterium]|nr:alpha/beta hydrolase [Thermotogaceae bacterium]HNR63494.1 alpha/beta hydrolase [Thermotogota bacterium]HNT94989.1 alpha/beta hydrolase [Thermotogota bacterium]HOZ11434.1 alpha/beta hydrolase [Thermotogota bacterium]HPB87317.1 alpha/beta hydrolase [Thermotogota bacterium]
MKIDFSYTKQPIPFLSGYIFKGINYRCSYIRFDTLYRNPSPGTETVSLYHFHPKTKAKATILILHGLGSGNIKFLLWMGMHLAAAGMNAEVLILPGNYTRVEKDSMSGRSYIWPDIAVMYRFWEHAVVDIQTTIDFLEQQGLWLENNCISGYCLGGMLASMVPVLDKRIHQTVMIATGGYFPKILYESSATRFARKLFREGYRTEYSLHDPKSLFSIYQEQYGFVKKADLETLLTSEKIHPLFRIDPIAYAHLLDKNRVTFIEAFFDKTLPRTSRQLLYREMKGANRYILPTGHTWWLPFEILYARYLLHRLHAYSRNSSKALLKMETIEEPVNDLDGHIDTH